LGTDGLRLHLGGPECGLGGLKAFPESLQLQDRVKVRRKLTTVVGKNGEMLLSSLIEQAAPEGPPLLRVVVGGTLPTIHE
jgi:hypothetical protein